MAAAILAMLPPVAAVIAMQRWFVKGADGNREVTRSRLAGAPCIAHV